VLFCTHIDTLCGIIKIMQLLHEKDPDIFAAINKEYMRQAHDIELIASENYASPAVMLAQGSVLTNKYAEGYPSARYYGGCDFVDVVERLAIERARLLFDAQHANVQPHSCSNANLAVLHAVLEPGDTILGMDMSCGGHFSHGMPLNISGKWFKAVTYGLDAREHIDYTKLRELALQHRPKLIIAGASEYSQKIDFEAFSIIAREVDAVLLADIANYAGLVVTGLYPNPFPWADIVTTSTHKTLRGPHGGMILCKKEWAPKIDKSVFPGIQGGPLMHVIAAKAVSLHEALQYDFHTYQQNVVKNAKAMSSIFQDNGFRIMSGGTECHMFTLDLESIDLSGAEAENLLSHAHITVNKSIIQSGIRLGTPAITTRGMKVEPSAQIAHWMVDILKSRDVETAQRIGLHVLGLTSKYQIY